MSQDRERQCARAHPPPSGCHDWWKRLLNLRQAIFPWRSLQRDHVQTVDRLLQVWKRAVVTRDFGELLRQQWFRPARQRARQIVPVEHSGNVHYRSQTGLSKTHNLAAGSDSLVVQPRSYLEARWFGQDRKITRL